MKKKMFFFEPIFLKPMEIHVDLADNRELLAYADN